MAKHRRSKSAWFAIPLVLILAIIVLVHNQSSSSNNTALQQCYSQAQTYQQQAQVYSQHAYMPGNAQAIAQLDQEYQSAIQQCNQDY